MPNWSVTIPEGMFVTRPVAAERSRFNKPQICCGAVIYSKYLLWHHIHISRLWFVHTSESKQANHISLKWSSQTNKKKSLILNIKNFGLLTIAYATFIKLQKQGREPNSLTQVVRLRRDVSEESERYDWLWSLTIWQHLDPFLLVVVLCRRHLVSGKLWPICARRTLACGVQVLKQETKIIIFNQKNTTSKYWFLFYAPAWRVGSSVVLTVLQSSLFSVGSL